MKMKTHEIRPDNPEYPFAVGDTIELKEYDLDNRVYTGRTASLLITYISPAPKQWLVDGYVVMSTRLKDPTRWYAPIANLFT